MGISTNQVSVTTSSWQSRISEHSAIPIICVALLIYVSNGFLFARFFLLDRFLQGIFLIPILIGSLKYAKSSVVSNSMILFAVTKILMEFWRGDLSYIIEGFSILAAFVLLLSVPDYTLVRGAKVAVGVAFCFAIMALLQFLLILLIPELEYYAFYLGLEGEEMMTITTMTHPVVLLGSFTARTWNFLGLDIGKFSSFAAEPSLLVGYFVFPAIVGLYINKQPYILFSLILLLAAFFSSSGSVMLALGFTLCCWILSSFINIKIIFPYGMILFSIMYILTVQFMGVDFLASLTSSLGDVNSALDKSQGVSASDRALPAVKNFYLALSSPMGSRTQVDIPGPWLVHVALSTGWFGLVAMMKFLIIFSQRIEGYFKVNSSSITSQLATSLFLGTMTSIFVFQDYLMLNYGGLVLILIIYRLVNRAQ